MDNFNQDFYNWLLSKKEKFEEFSKHDDICIRTGFENQLICLDQVIKKYKEICFDGKDE